MPENCEKTSTELCSSRAHNTLIHKLLQILFCAAKTYMNRLYILLISCMLLVGCNSTKEVAYLQNLDINKQESISASKGITIQPKDVLSIIISCKDAELAAMFNLPVVSYQTNSEIVSSTGGTQQLLGYAVDENGEIKLPVLGKMKVAGMTRWEVQEKIKSELKSRELLKDMVVTVEFRNFKISILGEVKNPGSYSIEGDKVNVLEAISMAGDLTIYGLRDQVYVIREEGGERTVYRLNLKSAEVFQSPAYYLKQNDVVYVQPNKVRAGESNLNENSMKSIGIWISIASLLTTVATLVVAAKK